jgi:hypothetical protein
MHFNCLHMWAVVVACCLRLHSCHPSDLPTGSCSWVMLHQLVLAVQIQDVSCTVFGAADASSKGTQLRRRCTNRHPLLRPLTCVLCAAAAAAAAAIAVTAAAVLQTVPVSQMAQMAKPLPKQTIDKGKVRLAASLGCTGSLQQLLAPAQHHCFRCRKMDYTTNRLPALPSELSKPNLDLPAVAWTQLRAAICLGVCLSMAQPLTSAAQIMSPARRKLCGCG